MKQMVFPACLFCPVIDDYQQLIDMVFSILCRMYIFKIFTKFPIFCYTSQNTTQLDIANVRSSSGANCPVVSV